MLPSMQHCFVCVYETSRCRETSCPSRAKKVPHSSIHCVVSALFPDVIDEFQYDYDRVMRVANSDALDSLAFELHKTDGESPITRCEVKRRSRLAARLYSVIYSVMAIPEKRTNPFGGAI